MSSETRSGAHWGALAEFDSPASLYHACEKVRDAGFAKWDAHTPFPVHGLDDAMGVKPTKLPFVVLGVGIVGGVLAFAMQTWMSVIDYPLIISGKPYFSWQAFIPITFELSILFAAFAAVFGMMAFNGLPQLWHPLFRSRRFERVTDDAFFISIEAADPKFDTKETLAFLQEIGATHVELVE